jgi:DNA-binding PadR family transcriptional regulator
MKRRTKIVSARRADDEFMIRDEPPLGSLQARTLKKLDMLKADAFGYRVLTELMQDSGQYMDPAQVYSAIRKMLEKGYIEAVGTRIERRGPPQKIYKLTEAGRAALKMTKAYHKALSESL